MLCMNWCLHYIVCCHLVAYRGIAVTSGISPVGIKEHVNECGGDGRQRSWIQRHDTEVVLRDQYWVNCGVEGWKRADSVISYLTHSLGYTLY